MSVAKRILGFAAALAPVLAMAQDAASESSSSSQGVPITQALSAYIGSTSIQKLILFVVTAFAYGIGFLVFTRLLPRQLPSSAGRFGCFWFAAIFLIIHAVFAIFFLHIDIPKVALAILVVILAIWLIVVYKKKR